MKILLVAHYFLPHIGGMEAVVKKQAKSLVKRGHEVTVLTCQPEPGVPTTEIYDGYTIKRLPSLNFIEKKFGITFPITSPHHLFWLIRNLKFYDIVHIHDVFYMSSHLAAIGCILHRKTFFLTQHVAMVDHPSKLVMGGQRFMYGTFGKLLFSRAVKIICYNHTVKNFLIEHGVSVSKIFMQYNGIDTAYFSPADQQLKQSLRKKYDLPLNQPIALFVGRLVPKKGYDLVYDAQSSNYFTLLVGDGKPSSQMLENENLRLFGPASATQVRDLYRASDVFVFPATGEIFTLVMQEAMASGLPVITSNDPGYKPYEFSRRHIKLVERKSDHIKDALRQTLTDKTSQKEISEYSRKFALENFDWERNYENEYALYQPTMDEKAAV